MLQSVSIDDSPVDGSEIPPSNRLNSTRIGFDPKGNRIPDCLQILQSFDYDCSENLYCCEESGGGWGILEESNIE